MPRGQARRADSTSSRSHLLEFVDFIARPTKRNLRSCRGSVDGHPRITASDVRRAARLGFRHHQGPARSSRMRQSPDRSSSAREAAQDGVDMCRVPISALTTAESTDSAIRSDAGPKVGSRTVTGLICSPCRISAGRRKMVSLRLLREATDGSNGGCIPCTSCRAAWPPATPAQAPAGPGQQGRWIAARPSPEKVVR